MVKQGILLGGIIVLRQIELIVDVYTSRAL